MLGLGLATYFRTNVGTPNRRSISGHIGTTVLFWNQCQYPTIDVGTMSEPLFTPASEPFTIHVGTGCDDADIDVDGTDIDTDDTIFYCFANIEGVFHST